MFSGGLGDSHLVTHFYVTPNKSFLFSDVVRHCSFKITSHNIKSVRETFNNFIERISVQFPSGG